MSQRKSQEQERAKRAWENVKSVKGKPIQEKYSSLAQQMPAYIQACGLGQTLAFLRAKADDEKKNEHSMLYQHISTWVMQQLEQKNLTTNEPDERLLEWAISKEMPVYRRATTEALAFLSWLKRFAEADIPINEQGN